MGIVEQFLLQLKIEKRRWRRATAVLTVLSLLVAVGVSWNLRMTAITLANDACCGYEEHQHTEDCLEKTGLICGYDLEEPPAGDEKLPETDVEEGSASEETTGPTEGVAPHTHEDGCYQWEYRCGYEEHIHSIGCYSDPKADVETQLDWQKMFASYPYTGDLRQDLVGIAKMQVGYSESENNFEADHEGLRHGYTRYGAWYGAPYNDWSAMFVSFCLNYARADLKEYPTSSGADTMAGLWNKLGKYASAGEYVPVSGDLVFFGDHTVGIVIEVQNATIHVISGDVEDAVARRMLSMNDASIKGWGVIEKSLPDEVPVEEEPTEEVPAEEEIVEVEPTEVPTEEPTEAPTEEPTEGPAEEPTEGPTEEPAEEPIEAPTEEGPSEEPAEEVLSDEKLLDISDGPAVFIFEGRPAQVQTQMQKYALRNPRTITDLCTYLEGNGGSYFFTLLDFNNVELPKDDQGNYIAQANTDYKLSISFNSPKGFLPGTYQYQVANGLMVDGGEGEFVLTDGTNVGNWVVTDTGLITLVFNENINSRTDITISVALGIHFAEQEEPIDFDGKITVTVEKPPQLLYPTQLLKWGQQGNAAGNTGQDPTKLYWTLQITGNQDSHIPGNILSDKVLQGDWSKDHRYTESDIAGGLTFGVSEPDPVTGEFKDWHSWHISADDPHLIWTETGWSYKMPETAICQWCGEVTLGNDNWIYTVNYTSTPDSVSTPGTYGYENEASIDGQHAYAWTDFTHGEAHGEITKTGTLVSDANGGSYLWEFQAMIPGIKEGQKADYHWYIMDYMYLLDQDVRHAGYVENDAHLAQVTANYNGTTIQVPRIQDATADDPFAWENAWTAVNDGVNYGREINLLCRCHCNESNCQFWNGSCGNYWFDRGDGTWITNGFCQCWTPEENITFTFAYTTDALPVIEQYGGLGYQLQNVVDLNYKPAGTTDNALVSSGQAAAPIPGMFKKELTHDFDGYTAHYKITVNEAKAVLTNGSPLVIHDVMTDTLAYISGSLVITTENQNGHKNVLQQGADFTVTYDGTGEQTDENGKKVHVLDIVILKPQPVMYILDYDTTLIMPEQVTGGIKYSNSATVTLWGEEVTDSDVEKVYANINIAAKSYQVELHKTCAVTGQPLQDATFGLYNAQGGLIATGVTDANGKIMFQTNVIEGIILREHLLYYLQEIQPPITYQRDDTKHWFCFCGGTDNFCEECWKTMENTDAVRIPFEQVGIVTAVNHPVDLELPSTGGIGLPIYILCGMTLISAPLVYGLSLRRRYRKEARK